MPSDWTVNDARESGLQSYQEGQPNTNSPSVVSQQLAPGKYSMFNSAPLFGLCHAGKYLHLRLSGGISIESTLADPENSVVAGSSTSYELQEMSIRCAMVKLGSALES